MSPHLPRLNMLRDRRISIYTNNNFSLSLHHFYLVFFKTKLPALYVSRGKGLSLKITSFPHHASLRLKSFLAAGHIHRSQGCGGRWRDERSLFSRPPLQCNKFSLQLLIARQTDNSLGQTANTKHRKKKKKQIIKFKVESSQMAHFVLLSEDRVIILLSVLQLLTHFSPDLVSLTR